MRESDLFEPVKKWLLSEVGCSEVYGEVLNCDVLGVCGSLDIIVEMKTSLSFKVIEQAIDRRKLGHYVYIAVPRPRKEHTLWVMKLLANEGIGLIYIDSYNRVRRKIVPKLSRLPLKRRKPLRSHIKDYSAGQVGGVPSGEAITDYSVTMYRIKEWMASREARRLRDGWVTVDEILESCSTHYASPKASLMQTLQAEWNESWCDTKKENGKRYFKLVDEGWQ